MCSWFSVWMVQFSSSESFPVVLDVEMTKKAVIDHCLKNCLLRNRLMILRQFEPNVYSRKYSFESLLLRLLRPFLFYDEYMSSNWKNLGDNDQ